jgi:hypothetical protein
VNQDTPDNTEKRVTIEDDDDDDDNSESTVDAQPDAVGLDQMQNLPPEPRRSNHMPGESAADKLRRAVEESKAAGEHVKANREARRQERSRNEDDALGAVDTAILHAFFSDNSQINLEPR